MKVMIIGGAGFLGSTTAAHLIKSTDFSIVSVDDLSRTPDLFNLEPVLNSRARHTFQLVDVFDRRLMNTLIKIEKPNLILFMVGSNKTSRSGADGLRALTEVLYEGNTNISKVVCVVPDGESEPTDCPPNTIFVRPCRIFGHRQHPSCIVPSTVFRLLNGNKAPEVNDNKNHEWLYIGDFITALTLIMKHGAKKRYFVSAGTMKTEAEIINKLAQIMDIDFAIDEGDSPIESTIVKNSIDVFELGWLPTRSLDDALSHTARWYHTNKWAFRNQEW